MNITVYKQAFTLITGTTLAVIGSTLPAHGDNTNSTFTQGSENFSHALTSTSELTSESLQPSSINLSEKVAQTFEPGRATRSGSSYIGVGGNIGLTGNTQVGEGSFAVISKIGLTRNLSTRPAALVGDNTVFLVPLTVDFPIESLEVTRLNVAPYIGGGIAISTGRDSTVGALISGGVDVPLSPQFTATGGVNVSFIDETDVGILLGVGYNF